MVGGQDRLVDTLEGLDLSVTVPCETTLCVKWQNRTHFRYPRDTSLRVRCLSDIDPLVEELVTNRLRLRVLLVQLG